MALIGECYLQNSPQEVIDGLVNNFAAKFESSSDEYMLDAKLLYLQIWDANTETANVFIDKSTDHLRKAGNFGNSAVKTQ